MNRKIIHVFRRDLRIIDNQSLITAHQLGYDVLPIFIFDPAQIRKHPFFSVPGFSFLNNSLRELNNDLVKRGSKLRIFHGEPASILQSLLTSHEFSGVTFNRDYTPFAIQRDSRIFDVCKSLQKECLIHDDALLTSPESGLKDDGTPYTVFTPYFRKNSKTSQRPVSSVVPNFCEHGLRVSGEANLEEFAPDSPSYVINGGRSEALSLLSNIKSMHEYSSTRNIPALESTSKLSAHQKFGTLSPREFYWEVERHHGKEATLISELHWRGFFTQIGFFFPHVFAGPFHRKYENIPWSQDSELLEKWQIGATGFPIVDAGMRELNATGFMHNRVRMIVASFLVKDLHINWREGERYFAQKLLDYDPAVNNGNWQWAASTGCDAQPYFRIFNPWLQQKKFDPDAIYIKRWVPELQSLTPQLIHSLDPSSRRETQYPLPLVDHAEESAISKRIYALV